VIVKLGPEKPHEQNSRLADEIAPEDWGARIYRPDILSNPEKLHHTSGYTI
jgi:hypothetical protein